MRAPLRIFAAVAIVAGFAAPLTRAGARPHTVSDRGGTFDTNAVAPGKTASLTFTVPGTYHYFCRINPSKMNGIVVVKPGAQPAATNRVEANDPALPQETFHFDPNNLNVQAG